MTLAAAEILLGFGPGHFLVRARAEPDAFLAFRPWLLVLTMCGALLARGTIRQSLIALMLFVTAATAGEWAMLTLVGRPDATVMFRTIAASLVLGLGIVGVAGIFGQLLGNRRWNAVTVLVFAMGMLAMRPPLLSPMRWFEQEIRPATPASVPGKLPRAVLLSDLPLVWGEGSTDTILGGGVRPPAAYGALAGTAAVVPVDVIDRRVLEGARLLILAQPRALRPIELVRIDDWVRAGGRTLIFADPALRWTGEMSRRSRLPPASSLLDPLFDHWGVEIVAVRPGFHLVPSGAGHLFGAGRIGVDGPGVLMARSKACDVTTDGLIADCRIGAGRALIVADADLLDDAAWAGPGPSGLSRAGRMADNARFVTGAVRALTDRPDRTAAFDEVRWMTTPPRAAPVLMLIGLAFPALLVLAATGIGPRLRRG